MLPILSILLSAVVQHRPPVFFSVLPSCVRLSYAILQLSSLECCVFSNDDPAPRDPPLCYDPLLLISDVSLERAAVPPDSHNGGKEEEEEEEEEDQEKRFR